MKKIKYFFIGLFFIVNDASYDLCKDFIEDIFIAPYETITEKGEQFCKAIKKQKGGE